MKKRAAGIHIYENKFIIHPYSRQLKGLYTPESQMFAPIFKLLGIKHRSYDKFAKATLFVDVREKEGSVTFSPSQRIERGGYESFPMMVQDETAPLADKQALAEAFKRVLEKCE